MSLDDETEAYPTDGEPNESSPGVTDTDDGGAILSTSPETGTDEPTADKDNFYRNLAEELDVSLLNRFTLDLLERIELDEKARADRTEKYEEGIKKTGLGDDLGSAAFEGGSKAVHPMMGKSIVYYQSHTIGELMPPNGPVRTTIPGKNTPDRIEKGKRKAAHMNWQFTKQMPGFRSQLEKLLSQQLPAGSQYMRLVYDSSKKRPIPTFWPIDLVLIPEAANDFYSAERRTLCDSITQFEFDERIRQGYYIKTNLLGPAQAPNKTKAQKANDKVEGVKGTSALNEDGLRRIYIVEALAELEDTDDLRVAGERRGGDDVDRLMKSAGPKPYLLEIDPYERQTLRVVRNWDKDDPQCENMCWTVDFECLPWRGAQSVGLIHYIGSLAGAGSGSLRSLLDTALTQNIPSLLKLKGVNMPGQTVQLNVCGVTDIEAGVAGDQDIRKWVMPVPFNPPSTMLYQLLGWCTEQGESLVRTTFENLSEDGSANMPVGTTLALIEQGMKVLCAIHARLHSAMDRLIGILHRINRMYITDEEIFDDTGEMLAYRSDYEGPVDVVPVSDPQVFSDVQRFAQLQIIQQRADLHPELYDARKVEELILERTKIPNATDLLRPLPQAQEMNAVNENVAMTLGRPVVAYPDQDHLAHIQVLLDYMLSPFFGMLSVIAPKYIPAALQHLAEHVAYWYMTTVVETGDNALKAAGHDLDFGKLTAIQDPDTKREMDETLAEASHHVMDSAKQVLSKIPNAIKQAQAMLQQLMPPPMQDPGHTALAVANANNASRERIASNKQQGDTQKQQNDAQAKLQQTIIQEQGDNQRTQAEIQSHEAINNADNVTALEIASAKIETGHSTNISTGTGLEGHEGPLGGPGGGA